MTRMTATANLKIRNTPGGSPYCLDSEDFNLKFHWQRLVVVMLSLMHTVTIASFSVIGTATGSAVTATTTGTSSTSAWTILALPVAPGRHDQW